MQEKEINYKEDVKIDFDNLDLEWIDQAELARRYAKHVSTLKKEVRRLEEKKKTIRSILIDKINRDPETLTGKARPNAADIEAAYRTNEEYIETVDELLDAQEEAEYAEYVYQEISWTRKKALEQLVTLHAQMYFAGPSVPRNLRDEYLRKKKEGEEKQKNVNKGIKSKLQRK
jgi:phage host-nuclease inhibitor protein Gam